MLNENITKKGPEEGGKKGKCLSFIHRRLQHERTKRRMNSCKDCEGGKYFLNTTFSPPLAKIVRG